MDDSDFARTPNPFSPFTNTASRPRRLASTFKLLLAAVVLMAVTTAGQHTLSRFRLAELLDGLSLGSAPQKIDRLEALGSYGDRGLPGIVSALADDQPEVAQAASSMITDMTLEWTTLSEEQQSQNRLALAESLNRVSQSISHTHDPKWQRLYRVAHTMTQQLIESPDGINQPAYPVLMRIVNRDTSSPEPDTDLTNDSEEKSRTLSDSPESWTDWPPQSDEESTAPSLYRRSVTTIATEKPSQILLSQATTDPTTDPTAKPEEPQLLRPNVRPASTLVEQSLQSQTIDTNETAYWVDQLKSRSPFVRMRAVTELAKRDDVSARDALERQFSIEVHPQVTALIESQLDAAPIADADSPTR